MTGIEIVCMLWLVCPTYIEKGSGLATHYGKYHHGKLMANQEPFNMYDKTLASRHIKKNRWVRVSSKENSIWCLSTDRGPYGAYLESGERVQRMHKKDGVWKVKPFDKKVWITYSKKPGKYRGLTDLSLGCKRALTGVYKGRPPNLQVKLQILDTRIRYE